MDPGTLADRLPEEVRRALLPAVPLAIEEAIATIATQYPDVARDNTVLAVNLRRGVTDAVERWFTYPDGAPPAGGGDVHRELGRAQARAGRTLEEMMGFYRVGARMVWRRLAAAGMAAGLNPEPLFELAELSFGQIDELSTRAAAGYAEEQSLRSGATQSRRAELVRMVLAQPQPSPEELASAAAAAGLELSARVAVFLAAAEDYERLVRQAGEGIVLGAREEPLVGLLLDPEGPRRRELLMAAARRAEVGLALGLAVPLGEARASLSSARALRRLQQAGALAERAPADARDWPVAVLLGAAPGAVRDLVAGKLAPLAAVPGIRTRDNLALTLRAWLRRPGERKAIAHELGIHPQTVRYRMARLHELFGGALDDPDERFELELAFRLRA